MTRPAPRPTGTIHGEGHVGQRRRAAVALGEPVRHHRGELRLVPRLADDGKVALALDLADETPAEVLVGLVIASLQTLCERRGLSTVRTCAAPDCVVRFSTTNARRQWCTSGGCGNRTRIRRHYERRKAAPAE